MNKKTTLTAVKLGFISHSDSGYAEDPSLSYKKRQTNQTRLNSGSYLVPLRNSILNFLHLIVFFTSIQLSWFEFSFADPIGQTKVINTLTLKLSLKI